MVTTYSYPVTSFRRRTGGRGAQRQCSLVPALNRHTDLQMHYSLVPLSSFSVQGMLSTDADAAFGCN